MRISEVLLQAAKFGRKGSIEPVDLNIQKGEIVGLAGLIGLRPNGTRKAIICSRSGRFR